MATSRIPGLIALDPNEPDTWAILRHWSETLPNSALEDRTKMYRERARREEFLNSIGAVGEEIRETYPTLQLQVCLRHPEDRELNRVVELINRTNQFNTTNARTTRAEIVSADEARRIIVADVSDKFGNMGLVGVLIVSLEETWKLTHFVLSCRVFGFGIEEAMINALKRWDKGGIPISGIIKETPANGPCRDVFERNGFTHQDGGLWVLEKVDRIIDPSWLSILDETSPGPILVSAVEPERHPA